MKLDFRSHPQTPRGLSDAEREAIAKFKGPVTKCPDGYRTPTFRPGPGLTVQSELSESGGRVGGTAGGRS